METFSGLPFRNFSIVAGNQHQLAHFRYEQIRQKGDLVSHSETVIEKIPKGYIQFSTRFFERSKSISGFSTVLTSGRTAYFSFFHIFPDIPFALVIVQRSSRVLQTDKKFLLICFCHRHGHAIICRVLFSRQSIWFANHK